MEEVITLEHVNKTLTGRLILNDVTLAVNRGDIFGYLGPNGAGKTTTIRIILGLMDATSGKLSVLGRDIQSMKTRRKIGFVLEADGLYDNMTAIENLMYYATLYDVPEPAPKISESLKMVGLADRANDRVTTYSKGMRQRLALARAITPGPELLVLDEPTAGVDPTGQIEIRQLMQDMIQKRGMTILLSSHNLDEVERICDRIALIHKGQIKLYGELEKLQLAMGRGGMEMETAEPIPPAVLTDLQSIQGITIREQRGKLLIFSADHQIYASDIVVFLDSKGVKVEQFKKQEVSLEEMYTSIVKEAEQK